MSITRKDFADDTLLQHEVFKSPYFQTIVKELADAGITSYSGLIEIISDENADLELRATACWTISNVHKAIDKRYILKPLMKAARSPHSKIQVAAIHSLSVLKNKQATDYLVNRACDKQESFDIRTLALQGLSTNEDMDYFQRLRSIIFDEDDDIRSRSEALEWLDYPPKINPVNDFIQLLQHPLPDLRFWAAYRLSQEWKDISKALDALDNVAAFDHQLPKTWGWHIDREALRPLESIYWRKLTTRRHYWLHPPMYLISPAPEYDTFVHNCRTHNPDWFYGNQPTPKVNLNIDPNWLTERLFENWPTVQLNIRDPRPKTYLLDWKLKIGQGNLIGGLHRDQYAVVLAGAKTAILKFAVWFRSLISKEQKLFIYEWADPGYELVPGMTTKELKALLKSPYSNLNPKSTE